MPKLTIRTELIEQNFPVNTNLLEAIRASQAAIDAPCGGNGKCGKCRVLANGVEVLACQTALTEDTEVTLIQRTDLHIMLQGIARACKVDPVRPGYLIAFDIGTTSVVCYLLDGANGAELAGSSMLNPQTAFGADVISRIQIACKGEAEEECRVIREGMTRLIAEVCEKAAIDPKSIGVVSVVGNPTMQQLFLNLDVQNLAAVPFAPVITKAEIVSCADYLPICAQADLLIVPDIAGYVGADTMGCVLSTGMYQSDEITLMVDIGTNGEMVLGNRDRMAACSTAAGPALEGANIRFGMRGTTGAIDHVWYENGELHYSVIGETEPTGICGSGLIDAIAVGLETGLLNKRGRIMNDEHLLRITPSIYLTQDDIRQVQMAKGAIYAGIALMAKHIGIDFKEIKKVLLAGAFGNYLNPSSACRIELLPMELLDRIEPVGNAAGSGSKMLVLDRAQLPLTEQLVNKIEFLELASLPEFSKTFAKSMNFTESI